MLLKRGFCFLKKTEFFSFKFIMSSDMSCSTCHSDLKQIESELQLFYKIINFNLVDIYNSSNEVDIERFKNPILNNIFEKLVNQEKTLRRYEIDLNISDSSNTSETIKEFEERLSTINELNSELHRMNDYFGFPENKSENEINNKFNESSDSILSLKTELNIMIEKSSEQRKEIDILVQNNNKLQIELLDLRETEKDLSEKLSECMILLNTKINDVDKISEDSPIELENDLKLLEYTILMKVEMNHMIERIKSQKEEINNLKTEISNVEKRYMEYIVLLNSNLYDAHIDRLTEMEYNKNQCNEIRKLKEIYNNCNTTILEFDSNQVTQIEELNNKINILKDKNNLFSNYIILMGAKTKRENEVFKQENKELKMENDYFKLYINDINDKYKVSINTTNGIISRYSKEDDNDALYISELFNQFNSEIDEQMDFFELTTIDISDYSIELPIVSSDYIKGNEMVKELRVDISNCIDIKKIVSIKELVHETSNIDICVITKEMLQITEYLDLINAYKEPSYSISDIFFIKDETCSFDDKNIIEIDKELIVDSKSLNIDSYKKELSLKAESIDLFDKKKELSLYKREVILHKERRKLIEETNSFIFKNVGKYISRNTNHFSINVNIFEKKELINEISCFSINNKRDLQNVELEIIEAIKDIKTNYNNNKMLEVVESGFLSLSTSKDLVVNSASLNITDIKRLIISDRRDINILNEKKLKISKLKKISLLNKRFFEEVFSKDIVLSDKKKIMEVFQKDITILNEKRLRRTIHKDINILNEKELVQTNSNSLCINFKKKLKYFAGNEINLVHNRELKTIFEFINNIAQKTLLNIEFKHQISIINTKRLRECYVDTINMKTHKNLTVSRNKIINQVNNSLIEALELKLNRERQSREQCTRKISELEKRSKKELVGVNSDIITTFEAAIETVDFEEVKRIISREYNDVKGIFNIYQFIEIIQEYLYSNNNYNKLKINYNRLVTKITELIIAINKETNSRNKELTEYIILKDKLKLENEELCRKITELNEQNRKELNKLVMEAQKSNNVKLKLENEIKELIVENSKNKSELNRKVAIEEEIEKVSTLKEEINFQKEKIIKLKDENIKKNNKIDEIAEEMEKLIAENKKIKETIKVIDKEISNKKEIFSLEKEQLENKIREQKIEIEKIKVEMETELEIKQKKYVNDILKYKKEIENLKDLNQNMEKDIESISKYKKLIEENGIKNNLFNSLLLSNKSEINKLEKQNTELAIKIKERDKKIRFLLKKNEETNSEEFKEIINKLEIKYKRLKEKYQKLIDNPIVNITKSEAHDKIIEDLNQENLRIKYKMKEVNKENQYLHKYLTESNKNVQDKEQFQVVINNVIKARNRLIELLKIIDEVANHNPNAKKFMEDFKVNEINESIIDHLIAVEQNLNNI